MLMFMSAPETYTVFDKMTVNGRIFELEVGLSGKFGDASAMNGGRILYFLMSEEGVAVCSWEEKHWTIEAPAMDEEANVAIAYFIAKYNRRRCTGPKDIPMMPKEG